MQKKFGALRLIAMLFKIIGVIICILAVIGTIFSVVGMALSSTILNNILGQYGYQADMGGYGIVAGVVAGLLMLITGGIWGLSTYGIGDLIYLLIAIEENMRSTTMLIQTGTKPQ